ncbi:MAG: FkbM family methyltransferase [Coleofasciculus chthonoplastes F3-SA18-01]|uniref:FkbM family methyltransferase n=1 Tax=Coleofasciculus chthonoplastes TaxID=64178 RepID=UPI00330287AA
MQNLKYLVSKFITKTSLQYVPVRVQKGLAKGALWTLFPYSSYWRGDTELDVEAAIHLYGGVLGATCWDLGMHFGIYTVGMAMAVGSEGQVVGFEPDPISFKRCQLHVQMNSLSQVKLFNAAVSESEGSSSLILSQGAGASTSHFAYEDEQPHRNTDTVTVQTVVLDKLVERGEIRPPQFIKVDVEGHGAKALSGARQTIADHHPTIVMSFHSKWELDGTREILEPLGYRSFSVEGKELEWSDSLFHTTVLRC